MIEEFCEEYFTLNAISPKRQRDQRKTLLAFEGHIDCKIKDAGPQEIRTWMVFLLNKRKLNPNTVRWYVNMIRPFFSWMADTGRITRERALEIQTVPHPAGSSNQGEPNPYNRKEVLQFWRDLDQHRPLSPSFLRRWRAGRSRWPKVFRHAERLQLDAITALALYCGLRQKEIRTISLDDIDPLNAYVPVQTAKRKGGQISIRRVPYPESARKKVEAWLEFRTEINPPHDYPWLTLGVYEIHHTNALPEKSLAELFGKIGAGYELHRFRHTCATEWLRAGMPLERVQRIMGHSTTEQTLDYAKIAPEDTRRSMEQAEKLFRRAIEPELEPDGNEDDSQEIA